MHQLRGTMWSNQPTPQRFYCNVDWEPFVQKLLKRLHLERLSPYLSNIKSDSGSREEEVKEEDMKEKVAKRLAANLENETQFDLDTERVPFELLGDSMTVVQWLRGLWRCTSVKFNEVLERAQTSLDKVTDTTLRTPCAGADCVKHMYREGNTYADKLSWECRGTLASRKQENFTLLSTSRATSLRGYFDGGVSREGAGGGWWLQAFFKEGSCIVAEEAFGLGDDATVTECELTAASRLVDAVAAAASMIALHCLPR